MSDDAARKPYDVGLVERKKYACLLLVAAAAAIGLAATRTGDAPLAWSHLPVAIAVLAWGLSFLCGCRNIEYVQSIICANDALVRVRAGRHPAHPVHITSAVEGLSSAMGKNNRRASFYGTFQLYALVFGVALYVGCQALEM